MFSREEVWSLVSFHTSLWLWLVRTSIDICQSSFCLTRALFFISTPFEVDFFCMPDVFFHFCKMKARFSPVSLPLSQL